MLFSTVPATSTSQPAPTVGVHPNQEVQMTTPEPDHDALQTADKTKDVLFQGVPGEPRRPQSGRSADSK
jgi:hypothetical protein